MKVLAGFICIAALAQAAEPQTIPLWPGTPPGSDPAAYAEVVKRGPDGAIQRVANVTLPTVTVYLPEATNANGTAVVICPGGGYRWLAFDYEGTDVAKWLASIGVAGIVVKYRVARTGDDLEKDEATMKQRVAASIPLALSDAQQAIRLVRSHASEWRLAPNRIGIMGFSAGGHLAAAAAMEYQAETRPDFSAPIYADIPKQITVPQDAPPLFLAHASDDNVVPIVQTSARMFAAWQQAGIPVEVHFYSRGAHGFGMNKKGLPVDTWTERFREWLSVQGLLKR